jgi:hypothetical protein
VIISPARRGAATQALMRHADSIEALFKQERNFISDFSE